MSDNDDRRDRIQQAWEAAWDRGEVDAFDELLSPEYRRFGSSDAGQDLTQFKASIIATRSAFPDLVTTIDDIVVEGDRAAVRWHSMGTTSTRSWECPPRTAGRGQRRHLRTLRGRPDRRGVRDLGPARPAHGARHHQPRRTADRHDKETAMAPRRPSRTST